MYKTRKNCTTISNCQCIKRIIYGLKYYSTLNINNDNNKSNNDIYDLIEFCTEKYKFIIDDFTHILLTHNDNFNKLYEYICNSESFECVNNQQCLSIIRNQNEDNIQIDDNLIDGVEIIFWRDLFDTIHCYMLHGNNNYLIFKNKRNKKFDVNLTNTNNINNNGIGYMFYYWNYYKNNDLFINKKYDNLKQELLNNKIYKISHQKYEIVKFKASEYIKCEICMNIESAKYIEARIHCDIKHGLPLDLQHLISIICYTDLTELSIAFQSTFYGESIKETKSRNMEYHHLSKFLCQIVECYGDKLRQKRDNLSFYCLSSLCLLQSFNFKFYAPISMTHNIKIFESNDNNHNDIMILQLNNCGNFNSFHLRKFNCLWISKYSSENEQLFILGQFSLRLQSIIFIQTKENFEKYFKSMFYLESMINGIKITDDEGELITKYDYKLIKHLIKYRLKGNDNNYPKYINDTFKKFCYHQQEIVINLRELDRHFTILKGLMIFDDDNYKNIVLISKISKLFPNCNNMIIKDINNGYSFKLLFLLQEIKKSEKNEKNNIMSIIIKVSRGRYYDDENSWLFNHYKSNKLKIEKEFFQQNWNINMTKQKDKYYIWDVVTLSNKT